MTEAQWLSPPVENELANRILIAYSIDSRRLEAMREQLELLETALENADELDRSVRHGISVLLEKEETRMLDLADNVEAMKDRLESNYKL